jgi:hypothetical protein
MMIELPSTIFRGDCADQPSPLVRSPRRRGARSSRRRSAKCGTLHFSQSPRNAPQLLWHDGRGYRILFTRLDRRRYRIPLAVPADARRVQISESELRLLLEGVDMKLIRAARRSVRTAPNARR